MTCWRLNMSLQHESSETWLASRVAVTRVICWRLMLTPSHVAVIRMTCWRLNMSLQHDSSTWVFRDVTRVACSSTSSPRRDSCHRHPIFRLWHESRLGELVELWRESCLGELAQRFLRDGSTSSPRRDSRHRLSNRDSCSGEHLLRWFTWHGSSQTSRTHITALIITSRESLQEIFDLEKLWKSERIRFSIDVRILGKWGIILSDFQVAFWVISTADCSDEHLSQWLVCDWSLGSWYFQKGMPLSVCSGDSNFPRTVRPNAFVTSEVAPAQRYSLHQYWWYSLHQYWCRGKVHNPPSRVVATKAVFSFPSGSYQSGILCTNIGAEGIGGILCTNIGAEGKCTIRPCTAVFSAPIFPEW